MCLTVLHASSVVIVKIHLRICGHGAETEWKITDRKLIHPLASVIQVGLVFHVTPFFHEMSLSMFNYCKHLLPLNDCVVINQFAL